MQRKQPNSNNQQPNSNNQKQEMKQFVTGRFEDDPFFTQLPSPPLASFDPCWSAWQVVMQKSQELYQICMPLHEKASNHPFMDVEKVKSDCSAARERYFEAARRYSACMDKFWGLNRFGQTAPKKQGE